MGRVTPLARAQIALYRAEGKSYREIARRTGVNRTAIDGILRRKPARRRTKEERAREKFRLKPVAGVDLPPAPKHRCGVCRAAIETAECLACWLRAKERRRA